MEILIPVTIDAIVPDIVPVLPNINTMPNDISRSMTKSYPNILSSQTGLSLATMRIMPTAVRIPLTHISHLTVIDPT
jgi:hypothetical protein